jgi:hypothetical protein
MESTVEIKEREMKTKLPFRFLAIAIAGLILAGCCNLPRSSKENLVRLYPELGARTTDLYEVSLDFWEQMDRTRRTNEINLLEFAHSLNSTNMDAVRTHAERLRMLQEGYSEWSKVLSEIRKRMNPREDVLFYYRHFDETASSKSNDGILIVRNGKIRDKIILNGFDAWHPKRKRVKNGSVLNGP